MAFAEIRFVIEKKTKSDFEAFVEKCSEKNLHF